MKECIFCEIPKHKERTIWQSDLFYAMFDAYPVSPGHFLVIPKRHVVDVQSLSEEERTAIFASLFEIQELISNSDLKEVYLKIMENPPTETALWFCQRALNNPKLNIKPDAYNYGINDGRAAGRTVDHLHLHTIPRYDGDVSDPTGGVRFVIPEMGNYKTKR